MRLWDRRPAHQDAALDQPRESMIEIVRSTQRNVKRCGRETCVRARPPAGVLVAEQ
ncbi:MAG: hypothetical protein ACTHQQ_16195 [Solirubrobacteraceae bacterium]